MGNGSGKYTYFGKCKQNVISGFFGVASSPYWLEIALFLFFIEFIKENQENNNKLEPQTGITSLETLA